MYIISLIFFNNVDAYIEKDTCVHFISLAALLAVHKLYLLFYYLCTTMYILFNYSRTFDTKETRNISVDKRACTAKLDARAGSR